MPNLAVIQLIRVIKWPRSDSDGSCVNKNVRSNKGFYSIQTGAAHEIDVFTSGFGAGVFWQI